MGILCLVYFCQFLNSLNCGIKRTTENNLPHGVHFYTWFLFQANLKQQQKTYSLGSIEGKVKVVPVLN
jgi:hypothetical protein